MGRSIHRARGSRWLAAAAALATAAGAVMTSGGALVAAAEPDDMVLEWNANAIAVLGAGPTATPPGLGQGPPVSALHLAMVQGAVYDAVNAIEGGYEPYLDGLPSVPSPVSSAAAAAGAAHGVMMGLAPDGSGAETRLNAMLLASKGRIPDGAAEDNGLAFGAAVAGVMLAARAGDGRFGSATWAQGFDPGEWREVPSATPNAVAWVADVKPFAIPSAAQFRTKGPWPLTSAQYAIEFNEVKAKGAKNGSTRTQAEDELASFVSANPLPYMNKGFRDVATARGLSTRQQARLFAITSVAGADALIGCWDDKRHWSFWRPYTAIRLAADDGNPRTAPDETWESLYATPGYPDHPSGYNCYTGAMMHGARLFFHRNDIGFTLVSPGTAPLTNITREYRRFTDVIQDTIDGRILTGFHFRTPDVQGAKLGRDVAKWVAKHEFEPVP